MTEQEKCNAGLPYRFDDPEMVARKTRAIREVHIGDHVMIGPHTLISTVSHPLSARERREYHAWAKPVTIGNDVWIGGQVTILPGVTVGDGAVIGAGAVVTCDIPPNTLAMGVPARVIRTLDEAEETH